MNKSATTVMFDPKNTSETALWVEKFKPKNFMELLSDDVSFFHYKKKDHRVHSNLNLITSIRINKEYIVEKFFNFKE